MKREFYVDTPLGELHIYNKEVNGMPEDYEYPGVMIDIKNKNGVDGFTPVATIEYDCLNEQIQTVLWKDAEDENDVEVIALGNLQKQSNKKPYVVTIQELSSCNVIIYAENEDEARNEAQTLWDLQEIVLDSNDFDEMVVGEIWQSVNPSDLEGYPVYGAPECDEEPPRNNLEILKDLIDYATDMEKEWDTYNGLEQNLWSDDVRALRWAVEKLTEPQI